VENAVVDDKFVKEPVKFSNQTTAFGQDLNGFSSKPKKGYLPKFLFYFCANQVTISLVYQMVRLSV